MGPSPRPWLRARPGSCWARSFPCASAGTRPSATGCGPACTTTWASVWAPACCPCPRRNTPPWCAGWSSSWLAATRTWAGRSRPRCAGPRMSCALRRRPGCATSSRPCAPRWSARPRCCPGGATWTWRPWPPRTRAWPWPCSSCARAGSWTRPPSSGPAWAWRRGPRPWPASWASSTGAPASSPSASCCPSRPGTRPWPRCWPSAGAAGCSWPRPATRTRSGWSRWPGPMRPRPRPGTGSARPAARRPVWPAPCTWRVPRSGPWSGWKGWTCPTWPARACGWPRPCSWPVCPGPTRTGPTCFPSLRAAATTTGPWPPGCGGGSTPARPGRTWRSWTAAGASWPRRCGPWRRPAGPGPSPWRPWPRPRPRPQGMTGGPTGGPGPWTTGCSCREG